MYLFLYRKYFLKVNIHRNYRLQLIDLDACADDTTPHYRPFSWITTIPLTRGSSVFPPEGLDCSRYNNVAQGTRFQ